MSRSPEVRPAEHQCESACSGDAGGQLAERHDERQDAVAERLVHIQGGPGRLGVLGDELGVGEAGQHRNGDPDDEGHPEGTTHFESNDSDQRVDA